MRKILAFLMGIVALVSFSVPAYAINPPSGTMTIDNVSVYGSVIEANDQLYLITFNIPYSTYPTETAYDAYLVRVFSSANVNVGAAQLYNNQLFHNGYGKGAISVYFSAADVVSNTLTWGSAVTINLEGNPALSWNGSIPLAQSPITSWNLNGANALGVRVLFLASQFGSAWGVSLASNSVLTSDGENYFTAIIPNLRTISPTIFSSFIQRSAYYPRTHGLAYAITLRNQWLGTWLDLTNVGADWGVDPIWFYGAIWVFLTLVLVKVLMTLNLKKFLNGLICIMIVLGTFAGFLSYVVGGLMALAMVLIMVNQISWGKSYA